MLKLTNHVLHIGMFGMVLLFSDYGGLSILIIFICMLFSWLVSHVGLHLAKSKGSTEIGALAIGIIMFFWVAYVSKMGFSVFFADQYWVVKKLISEEVLLKEMPVALLIATGGYLALMIGVFSFPLRGRLRWEIPEFRPRIHLLFWLIPLLLVGKYILKAQFNLGVPSVDPEYLGIPYLAGLLTFIIDTGFIFVSNILLFCGLAFGRLNLMFYGLFLGFANAGIDLRFGSKDTVMYQLAITAAYLAMTRFSLAAKVSDLRKTSRFAITFLVVLGITTIFSYKFFNAFRFAMLYGSHEDVFAAINIALLSEVIDSSSSFMDIYNRITGLETLAAIVELRTTLLFSDGLAAIFKGSIVNELTYIIMNTDEAKTAFAVTQFGSYYVVGGSIGLIIGSLIHGFFFSITQFFVLRMKVHRAMTLAFLPILWILFIKSLLGGGNVTLWLKELVVLLATFYVCARIASPSSICR